MANEVIIEAPSGEAAAAPTSEVLAEVASKAIDETAERIETLVRATAEITAFRGELDALREAFRLHVEGVQVDFVAVREKLETLERGLSVMAETMAQQEIAVEEVADDIADTGEVVADVTEEVADVAAAESEEAPLIDAPEIHTNQETRKRAFIRI